MQQAIKLRRAILSQFVHLSLSWLKTEWLLHRSASFHSLSASLTQQLALNLGCKYKFFSFPITLALRLRAVIFNANFVAVFNAGQCRGDAARLQHRGQGAAGTAEPCHLLHPWDWGW